MISNEGGNLVFILSLPRSGSTMLGAIMGNNSKVYCPPEPWILLKIKDLYGKHCSEKIYDDHLASLAIKAFLPEEVFVECARAFTLCAYNSLLVREGKDIFIDKTPRYYHILNFIDALFPKAKKIWLKRNPLDVASSYKTTWDVSVDTLVGENLNEASFDFMLGLQNLIEYFDEKSPYKYETKYEDIVTSADTEVARLASFCELDFEKDMPDFYKNKKILESLQNSAFGDKKLLEQERLHSESIGKWENDLSAEEVEKLVAALGAEVFTRMGYAEIRGALHDIPQPVNAVDMRAALIKKFEEKYTKKLATGLVDGDGQLQEAQAVLNAPWYESIDTPLRWISRKMKSRRNGETHRF